ncbi:MAG: hypothetical protein QM820_04365 [Minicystis sp.]
MPRKSPLDLPLFLAGPILRRVDEQGVFVWLATKIPVQITGAVYTASSTLSGPLTLLGRGSALPRRFGERLYVTLLRIDPDQGTFPADQLLAYNLIATPLTRQQFEAREAIPLRDPELDAFFKAADMERLPSTPKTSIRLDQFGEFAGNAGRRSIAYGRYRLPTFFISRATPVNLLHASCRKPHGHVHDAMTAADSLLGAAPEDLNRRPSALFLTGNRIYGDDVPDELAQWIVDVGQAMLGFPESITLETSPRSAGNTVPPSFYHVPISTIRPGMRGFALADVFTVNDLTSPKGEGRNHLMGFGEYVAAYLLSWNRDMWPELEKPSRQVQSTWNALPLVRRALANVPTYMIFDDHEVTDDWNRTQRWKERVYGRAHGRRVVANALSAYWVCQATGNNPTGMADDLSEPLSRYFGGDHDNPDDYEKAALAPRQYAFVTPTNPPVVCLDTRTRRAYPTHDGPARLMDDAAIADFVQLARRALSKSDVLAIVSAAPVWGPKQVEGLLDTAARVNGDYADYEPWAGDRTGFYRFILAIHDLRPGACVFFSGDLHFGFAVKAVVTGRDGRRTPFVQFTSSAACNLNSGLKRVGSRALSPASPYTEIVARDRSPAVLERAFRFNVGNLVVDPAGKDAPGVIDFGFSSVAAQSVFRSLLGRQDIDSVLATNELLDGYVTNDSNIGLLSMARAHSGADMVCHLYPASDPSRPLGGLQPVKTFTVKPT